MMEEGENDKLGLYFHLSHTVPGTPFEDNFALQAIFSRPFLTLRLAYREFGDCQSIRALYTGGVIMNINGEIINIKHSPSQHLLRMPPQGQSIAFTGISSTVRPRG